MQQPLRRDAGLMRASKLWTYADVQKLWPPIFDIVSTAVGKASPHGYKAFVAWLPWMACDQDPRRFPALKEFWLQMLRGQNATEVCLCGGGLGGGGGQ